MVNNLEDCEGLCIRCEKHNDQVKLAKNKGSYWKSDYNPDWLSDFLNAHQGCKLQLIGV